MGSACGMQERERKYFVHTEFWSKDLKERVRMEDVNIDGL